MKLLLDTHVLLWAAGEPRKLPEEVRSRITDDDTRPMFSAASIWEVAIKSGLGREDFQVNPRRLRRGLLENGHEELAVTGLHAAGVGDLPAIHNDPFDRLLIAQAREEALEFLTADQSLADYGEPIRLFAPTS